MPARVKNNPSAITECLTRNSEAFLFYDLIVYIQRDMFKEIPNARLLIKTKNPERFGQSGFFCFK